MKGIYILILILMLIPPAYADAFGNITTSEYRCLFIDDISNIKYINSYNYSVFVNDTYLGEYAKGDCIEVPNNTSIIIYPPSNIKQNINANNFASMIGVGFYAFMQYGIYIIIILLVIWYRRKRR